MKKIENPPTMVEKFDSHWREWVFKFYESATRNTLVGIADGDTTPSVFSTELLQTENTGATTITDFDAGYVNQKITIIFGDGNTTVDFTSSNLKGNGGVDWSPAENDHMTCVYNGTYWFCTISEN